MTASAAFPSAWELSNTTISPPLYPVPAASMKTFSTPPLRNPSITPFAFTTSLPDFPSVKINGSLNEYMEPKL